MVVLRALPFIFAAFQAQTSLSFDGSVIFFRPGSSSTLDGHVAPDDLALQETVLNIVDGGLLAKSKNKPQFVAPSSKPESSDADNEVQGPLMGPVLSQKSTDVKPTKASPLQKWARSGNSIADTESSADDKAPKVARRLASPIAKPLPRPEKKQNTAVASDLSKQFQKEEVVVPETEKTPSADASEPSSYPTPVAQRKAPAPRASNLPPLTRSQQNLRKKIRSVLTHYYNRPMNTRDRSPWELMHAMLAFEAHSKVLQGGPNGEPITAVGWLCYNRACKRRTLMYVNDDDELRVRVGPALQGHRGQLLAMLAQSRINKGYPMLVEGKQLTIADLIEMEKSTCYPRTELTFKLIGLMHYLDSDAKWMNDQGMQWDIPRMISEELRQPVRGAACGGTHRLSGLTLAYKTRMKRGEPVDGQYLQAKKFVTRYQQYAYRLQNRDGSFSTEWFRGPGDKDDIDRKLKTTGHILEWLLYAATDKELKHWKTTKAANYLANIMYRNRYKDWESGPLGHAIHALLVYDRLVFSPYDPPETLPMAQQPTGNSRRR